MRKKLEETAQTIDIFELNSFRTYQNIVATRFARQHGTPYVLRAHGSLPRLGKSVPKWIFDITYGNRILSNSSSLVAVTRTEADQYDAFGAEPSKVSVIPNGVELARFSNLPARGEFASKFKVDSGTRIILFLGRVHWIKGIDTLLKSYRRLTKNKSDNDALLVIAGPDDGYLRDAQLLARRLGIGDKVLFCGLLNFKEKLAAIVDSAVVVLPSYYETFPNVVLESYACSRPVIASRVQGMEEIVIDGQTGVLFSAGNVEQITDGISRMLKDVEWVNAMGKRARELVEREYDQSKLILRTEAIYDGLVKGA
jgi:glycosyltransferase involved in cell wall biosynthesis